MTTLTARLRLPVPAFRSASLALVAATGLLVASASHASDAPLALGFGDFFVQPLGPRGLTPTPRLLDAVGREVRLVGFMVHREHAQPGRFLLTPRPLSMAEHADGEADDLPAATVTVLLAEGQAARIVAHQPGPLTLTGRLEYGPLEDETGRISWLRLRLPPEALAAPSAAH
ncbi:MAG: hypothetical protein JNL93_12745 [Pelomonas sp.]|nr:hypothetical protein [Roseateles sp.]